MGTTDLADRGIALVRVVAAVVCLSHAGYLLAHADVLAGLGRATPALGLPLGVPLAWAGVLLELAAAVALLVHRRTETACAVLVVLVTVAALLYQWPDFYVVGGNEVTGHPGIELSVLLVACLTTVRRGRGLGLVRIAAAVILFLHGGEVLLRFDSAGMRGWGAQMEAAGFPFGVALVWSVVTVQAVGAVALLVRRAVVPACIAQVFVLANGIWTTHAPYWFVVGPGRAPGRGWFAASGPDEGGMELSVLLIAALVAVVLSHYPQAPCSTPSSST
jgi:uncharacterized membrane protein YphA (DoxX/SURF4 family)